MFDTVLIANRGEIACRVARSCRALGIRSVAVFSAADADALHVAACDEAHAIGPAPARESYLDVERVLAAARASGARAIHPGYGFLSENADFAQACEEAGIIFVGPKVDTLRSLGDKVSARKIAEAAGVPVLGGSSEAIRNLEEGKQLAEKVGYPIILKAAHGGGGRGMRVVNDPAEFENAFEAAAKESQVAFGSDEIFVEKFIERARHIEVQLLGDKHGNLVHLFERDCSVQRRHQKVVEIAPAPNLDPSVREALCDAAIKIGKQVDYENAGTVEFLVDAKGSFYFLEMNTRVQVEHAITEAVTGIDIVKVMIQIAAGEPLPFGQEDLGIHGHAIEARIYAEDPDMNFAPSPGDILVYRPPDGIGIRVDSGVYQGAAVTVNYDPMVAKLIAWGIDRQESMDRLRRALQEFVVKGIKTSIPFHLRVLRHPKFLEGHYDTTFIDAEMGGGKGGVESEPAGEEGRAAKVLAAIAAYRRDKERAKRAAATRTGGGRERGARWRI